MKDDPAHKIRQYLESYARLASAKGLEMTGMPSSSENVQRHMQDRHADLVLLVKGLTPDEMSACSLAYAGIAGSRSYVRFIRSPSDAQPSEQITKNSHPDDPTMIEVRGTCTRGYNRQEIAAIMNTSQYRVSQMLATAKAKVERAQRAAERNVDE